MYPDASGLWSSNTILFMPLPPGIDHLRPGELHEYLHEYLNDEHVDVMHNPDLMLEMFDRGLVYPAVHPAPIEELKKAALDYFALSKPTIRTFGSHSIFPQAFHGPPVEEAVCRACRPPSTGRVMPSPWTPG
jgi:hypothetical protein